MEQLAVAIDLGSVEASGQDVTMRRLGSEDRAGGLATDEGLDRSVCARGSNAESGEARGSRDGVGVESAENAVGRRGKCDVAVLQGVSAAEFEFLDEADGAGVR